ncbi:DUF6113 family protein [Actinocorallia sp. API 0066]|uniref:DUF6113 family protein n=1 Tax=Actinocorallia sp. API 0066 TaxID=2896846 RepID=UPI001E553D15|nr:DUF6113 family protein [Actinocorallia sp. API 0066]MCD0447945.1 DUF6113 family protein [Actinocorallia sp. API 0066]
MDGRGGAAKGALYGLLAVGGALVGLIGAFQYNRSILVCLLVVAFTFLAVRGAGWASGARTGALVPAVAWVVTTGALSVSRPEGDVIVTNSTGGLLFLFGGVVAALAAVLLTPANASFLTGLPYDAPTRPR